MWSLEGKIFLALRCLKKREDFLNGLVFHAKPQITVISRYHHSFLFVFLLLLIHVSLCFLQPK
jgi:hypothetical protein